MARPRFGGLHRKAKAGERRQRGYHAWVPAVTVALVACTAVLALLCFLSMHDVEQGLLSVVTRQQDEYVDLVVGQIELHNESDDDAIVNDILGVIDDSSGQYWTLSRDGSLVYVRDVTETSRYKGMPAATYFDEGAPQDFYEGLSTDETSHAYLTIGGRDYIASGRVFDYDGSTYRLCLLTNEATVLDDNQILGARSRLGALLGIETALLLFVGIWLAVRRDQAARQLEASQQEVGRLNGNVERLDARIARDRIERTQGKGSGEELVTGVTRTYRLKFYLNAQHYIIMGGKRGETHPHTWEFALTIGMTGHEFVPFSTFEGKVNAFLAPYQNQVLNEVAPFDTVLPTLENLVEEFAEALRSIIAEAGGVLVELEGSEGPTRSYGVRLGLDGDADYGTRG